MKSQVLHVQLANGRIEGCRVDNGKNQTCESCSKHGKCNTLRIIHESSEKSGYILRFNPREVQQSRV